MSALTPRDASAKERPSPAPATQPERAAMAEPPDPVLLDLRGLKCPLPVLRTRKALVRLPPGGRLRVACTDPLSVIDIPHLAATLGDVLEGRSEEGGVYIFSLRRS